MPKLPTGPAAAPDADAAAVAMGLLRGSFGVVMLAAPALLPRLLGADARTAGRLGYLTRMVGVRELAVGLGGVRAAQRGTDVGSWLVAQAACDAGDAVTMLAALRAGRVNRLVGGAIVASAVAGVAADLAILRRGRPAG